ncbi:MAG: hypothetical protein J6O55_00480 [Lachnospiraceae bacterium]|nr:hypothetical protein [Lachnospiraceae bacterium]
MEALKKIIEIQTEFNSSARKKKSGIKVRDYLKYLYYRLRYKVPARDYFDYRLYEAHSIEKAYFETNLKRVRSWSVAIKKFRPDAGKCWRIVHYLDYFFSRFVYPGLDAHDYLAYRFYEFKHNKRKTFVTEGYFHKLIEFYNFSDKKVVKNEIPLLSNKGKFNAFFSDFVKRKWILAEHMSFEDWNNFSKDMDRVIVKPLDGSGGHGIKIYKLSGEEERKRLYGFLRGQQLIAEEVVKQHPLLDELNPASVNTIRIFSVYTKRKGAVITNSLIRIGNGTADVDNVHSGGYVAKVDVKSGIVDSAAIDFEGKSVYVHPRSGKTIIGMRVPEWKAIISNVKKAHRKIPNIRYIGWDIAVGADSSIIFIEGNPGGGVAMQQHPTLEGVKALYDRLRFE